MCHYCLTRFCYPGLGDVSSALQSLKEPSFAYQPFSLPEIEKQVTTEVQPVWGNTEETSTRSNYDVGVGQTAKRCIHAIYVSLKKEEEEEEKQMLGLERCPSG